ncbi:MAG: hypothetical protein ABIH23_14470 [bacterium]
MVMDTEAFRRGLERLINECGVDSFYSIPDNILADYLVKHVKQIAEMVDNLRDDEGGFHF